MGNCNACAQQRPNTQLLNTNSIKQAIQKQRPGVIGKSLEGSALTSINDDFVTEGTLTLNPLGYALIKGKTKSFQYLVEELGASVDLMEHKLAAQGTSALKILCELGYDDLLDYYLPLHTKRGAEPAHSVEITVSVDFSRSVLVPAKNYMSYLPVHIACENGRINILSRIRAFYKGPAPMDLDIHAIDDHSGENCPLIACRQMNFTMIKFLHEHCRSNFNVLNKRQENTVNVVVSASKRTSTREALDCLKYLVETVGVDVAHHHEESLLLAEDPEIVQYLENCLWERGIHTRKEELERSNRITPQPSPLTETERRLAQYEGEKFEIKDIMQADNKLTVPSMISEIRGEDSMATPIVSTLIPFTE